MVCSACHSLMSVSAPNGGSPSAINDKAKKKINEGLLGDPGRRSAGLMALLGRMTTALGASRRPVERTSSSSAANKS